MRTPLFSSASRNASKSVRVISPFPSVTVIYVEQKRRPAADEMGAREVRVYVTGIECNDVVVDPARGATADGGAGGDVVNLWERFSAELVADNARRGCAVTVAEPWWWGREATGRRHAPDPAAWIGACDAVVVFVGTLCGGGAPAGSSGAQTARLYCVHYDIGVASALRLPVLFYSYPNGCLLGDADGDAGTLYNGIRYAALGDYVDWDGLIARLTGAYTDGDADDYSDENDNYYSSGSASSSDSSGSASNGPEDDAGVDEVATTPL